MCCAKFKEKVQQGHIEIDVADKPPKVWMFGNTKPRGEGIITQEQFPVRFCPFCGTELLFTPAT